jgi:phosphatidylinositol alpha-1,6-mannosyltransferase
LKTLFVSPDFKPAPGGIAELYLNLLARFPPGSVEVSTVRAPAGTLDVFPFPVLRMPLGFRESSRAPGLARWFLQVRRRVREGGHDALQIGTLRPAGPIGAWLQRLQGTPFVIYVHGKDVLKERGKVERSRLYAASARDVLRRAGAVIANSRFTAGLVHDLAGAVRAREAEEWVRVVHPGADPLRFHPGADGVEALRSRLGLHGKRVALTVSRLLPRKGVDRTLEAVAALAPHFPDLVYLVVGDGHHRATLESRAAAPDLAGRVRFLGWVEDADLPVYYRMAELFLLPSRRDPGIEVEGFGLVLSEAGASGIPVIGGDSGGASEAVVEGETGLLVDPEDPREIAATLRRLLEDRALAERLGRGGREAVLRYFNWDRAAAEAFSIVREAAGTRPRRAARRKAAS